MSSHRGLRPAAGVVLCIGTGCAAAVLSDADSEGRRRISSAASEVRREVLLRALSKRLLSPSRGSSSPEAQQHQHQQEETQRSPTDLQHPYAAELTTAESVSSAAEPESISKRFYVVTGPDADLTSLARERLSRALLSSDNNSSRASQREPPTLPLPARLVVPYDCVLGTGRFSLLVEQQLLQDSPLEDVCGASSRVGGRLGVEGDVHRQPQQQQQQQQEQHLDSHDNNVTDNHSDNDMGDKVLSKQGPDARAPPTARTLITNWESFLLRATLPFMDAEQLDQAALWALDNALSGPTAPPAAAATTAAGQPHTTTTAPGKGKELSAGISRSTAQVASRGETATVANHEPRGEKPAGHLYSDNNHDHDPARGGEGEEEDSSSGSFSDGAVTDFGEGGEGDAAPKTADFAFAETESEVKSDTESETDSRTGSETESENESETGLPSVSSKAQTQIHAVDRRSFVLEIAWSAREHDGEGTPHGYETGGASIVQEGNSSSSSSSSNRHSSRALCGELARWGWRLATRGLGHAVISSPNPWVLAEVQRALQAENKGPIPGLSPEAGTGSSDGGGVKDEGDASAIEVTVVRVALPSAAEREQAVVSMARELGVNDHLSALDVSKLAEVTGGRHAALLDALGRVRGSSTVAEACQAVVDDQALALASSWGLLPRDSSLGEAEEVATSYHPPSGTVPEAQATRSHTTSIARGVSIGTGGGAVCGGDKGREEWAPLWEALGVLSMPSVSIGAGPTSAPTPPQGCLLPSQLSDESQVDAEALLGLMQAGWLEISPSAPPGSGTALEDPAFHAGGGSFSPSPPVDGLFFRRHHRRPPVTVQAENVPLASLARLDRSFVGAPPLRLAAFRRLLDSSKPWATASRSWEFGAVCREGDGGCGGGGGSGSSGSNGRGGGGGGGRLFEAPRGQAAIREGVAAEEADASGAWRGGEKEKEEEEEEEEGSSRSGRVGSVDDFRDRELAQAGCLIEASMLARVLGREEAKLSEDREALSSHWAELGTARRGLERDGKRDASDGEWAEVQLELIRQERAVVARANEMRARRARLDVMRSEILELEHSANPLLPPSLLLPSLPPPTPPSVTPTSPSGIFRDFSREYIDHQGQHQKHSASTASGRVGVDRGWVSTAVEEAVIGDAEKGVILVPLRKGFEMGQAAGGAGLGEGRARGKPVKGGDGVGGDGDSGKGRWRLARGFWRWMRGY